MSTPPCKAIVFHDLVLDTPCQDCEGKGWTIPYVWTKRRATEIQWRTSLDHSPTKEEIQQWDIENPTPNSPEEVNCIHCRGIGAILTADGAALYTFLDRYFK